MHTCLNILAGVSGITSALLWAWAAWIPQPQSKEKFFAVLDSEGATPAIRKIARRNQWAAASTGLASLFAALSNLT
jgi:hypothetical protein